MVNPWSFCPCRVGAKTFQNRLHEPMIQATHKLLIKTLLQDLVLIGKPDYNHQITIRHLCWKRPASKLGIIPNTINRKWTSSHAMSWYHLSAARTTYSQFESFPFHLESLRSAENDSSFWSKHGRSTRLPTPWWYTVRSDQITIFSHWIPLNHHCIHMGTPLKITFIPVKPMKSPL